MEGVAEVNALGGEVRSFHVIPNPQSLLSQGLNIGDVQQALERNNRNAGGDRIVRNNEVILVRTIGQIKDADDIRNITVATRNGVPVHIKDIAEVRLGALVRYGGVTKNGKGEFVEGLVMKLKGANANTTVKGVKRELKKIVEQLPEG